MSFISHIKEEFQVIQERDPAIKTPLEVLLYPSFRVMIKYRRAHKLYLKRSLFSGTVDFPAGSQKDRDRDPSGCYDRKGTVHRSRKRCDHWRDYDHRR